MASWRYSIGNAARRAASAPVAVAPATADAVLGLATLANDHPDERAGLAWRTDGAYAVDVDVSLLSSGSAAADAPTGWRDLLMLLAGTPGLPADQASWGTFAGRASTLRVFRPGAQEVEVMPGETVQLQLGLHLPAASSATGARVIVSDLSTGLAWNGSAWAAGGVVATQAVDDAWLDVDEEIAANPARKERGKYRVLIEPVAAAYDATTYVYASDPALIPAVDLVALIGHNLPPGATVSVGSIPMGSLSTPSSYAVAEAPDLARTWRLSIAMPLGTHARPIIGELWLGLARTLLVGSPMVPIDLGESSPGQIQVEGARKRVEVVGEDDPPVAELALQFRTRSDAAYEQVRDEIARMTQFGKDPLLLLPSTRFEGGRLFHGRIEDRVVYSRITPAEADPVRAFALPFHESPLSTT